MDKLTLEDCAAILLAHATNNDAVLALTLAKEQIKDAIKHLVAQLDALDVAIQKVSKED